MSRSIIVGTSRQLCRHVAERWHDQYGDTPLNPKHVVIQDALDDLRKKGTRAEIDDIIGNSTWTCEMCDVCGRRVEVWVNLGREDDYHPGTNVCRECLDDAVVEIEAAA